MSFWLSFAIVFLLLPLIPLGWIVFRQLRRQWQLFVGLAETVGGTVTKLPMGVRFEAHGARIRLFALQGSLHYRARLSLRTNPGILVTRKFGRFNFLDALHYSPSRERVLFPAAIDERYGFRAREASLLRSIFTEDILARMADNRRLARIEISQADVRASIFILSHAEDEEREVLDAVGILDLLLARLRGSGLVA